MPSEDGWEPAKATHAQCVWIVVPGTNPPVRLEILKGLPVIMLSAFAGDFNAYVEPLRDNDSACYTETNAVSTSNHLNGTACDFNWELHPFHKWNTFNSPQMATLTELFAFYEDNIAWGGKDWGGDPQDEMHFQMGYNTFNNPRVADFIGRKIRPDGFSTFRRGGMPVPAPVFTHEDAVALLIINESKRRNHRPDETIAEIATGIQESNLNPEAVDPTGHRGVYQQDGGYPDRGTVEGQIKGFFDRLDAKRASPGASPNPWLNIFWLQQRPSDPSADDAYARGRKGYLNEIQSRLPAATDFYNRLAGAPAQPPTTDGEDWLMGLNEAESRELLDRTRQLWGALFNENPSTSRYGDPDIKWPNHLYIRNIDGHLFDLIVEHDAALGQEWALNQVAKKAAAGDGLAQAFLDRLNTPAPAPTPASAPAPVPLSVPAYVPMPLPVSYESQTNGKEAEPVGLAQVISKLYEVLDKLQLSEALDIKDRVTLAATIKVLETKAGSQT